MEGALARLLDPEDAVARTLAAACTIHLVPNMCPDGTAMGHLRVNSVRREPEPRVGRADMGARGPRSAACWTPWTRAAWRWPWTSTATRRSPTPSSRASRAWPSRDRTPPRCTPGSGTTLAQRTPDFQTAKGYPVTERGKGNPSMSTNQVAARFGAVAITLGNAVQGQRRLPRPGPRVEPGALQATGAGLPGRAGGGGGGDLNAS